MKTLNKQGIIELYNIVKEDLEHKVDKETGKALSSNDYTTPEKQKLAGLENYTHPTYKATTEGLYKIAVSGEGHITITAAVDKEDITGLGIPSTDTTYTNATETKDGLFSKEDKNKLDGIEEEANKYTHPTRSVIAAGLHKTSFDAAGHIATAVAVTKADVVALGIPAQDTTYSAVTTTTNGLMIAADKVKLNTIATNANNYSHPTRTAIDAGIYKTSFDTAGHIATAVAITKADITALDIPAQDTTYKNVTSIKDGLMAKEDKVKLDKVNASAQVNAIEKVSVNGVAQTINNKEINLKMPIKVSELTNDSNYITETRVDGKISTAIGQIISFDVIKVDVLPDVGLANTIYLVPKMVELPEVSDSCDEYMYIDAAWERIGNTQTDLTDYNTKGEINALLDKKSDITHTHNEATQIFSGLMAASDKVKLDAIEIGTNDYHNLLNKPKINGVELLNQEFEDLGLLDLTNEEIENILG